MSDGPANSFLDRIERYAEEKLRPAALETDRTEVPAETIRELGELGALNHLAPARYGGAGLGRDDDRRLHEIIAGACFNTWLVWAQHASVTGRIEATYPDGPPPGSLADQVLRGRLVLGAGISDVRRFPDRYIAATRTPGGWTFDGTITWVSGWGLNQALTVAAIEPGTRTVVTALVPVGERTRATPLRLGVVTGSRTERVRLEAVDVAAENVLSSDAVREAQLAHYIS